MKRLLVFVAVLTLLLTGVKQAQAIDLTYSVVGTGTGSLGATNFTNALVTVSFTGNTVDVMGSGGFFSNTVGTATVTVTGIGTATFTDAMEAFVNQGMIAAGVVDLTLSGSVFDTFNAAFATYDLRTPLGPLSGAPFIRPDLTFPTTLGGFHLASIAGNSTFTAAAPAGTVPEPAGCALLAVGTLGLLGYGWRAFRPR
jgi:hypothetical protein